MEDQVWHGDEFEALATIALAINSTLVIDGVLDIFLQQLAVLVPYDSACVALAVDGHLSVVAIRGIPDRLTLPEAEAALNQGTGGVIFQDGEPRVVSDVRLENRWVISPGLEKIRSWMGIPLISRGRPVGLLTLDKAEPGYYSQTHARRAIVVAQIAATAVENAQLYSEMERRVAERTAELQAQMNRMQAILHNVADAIVFTGADHQVEYVNPAWEKMTGYASDEILGRNIAFMLADEESELNWESLRSTLAGGVAWQGWIKAIAKDEHSYDADTIATPICDETGSVHHLLYVQRDLTKFRELEEMKLRFVADVAHDLGNPVTNLNLRLQLIDKQPHRLDEHLTVIRRQADRLDALVKDLLILSRLDLGVMDTTLKVMNLNAVVSRIVQAHQALAEGKAIGLSFELLPDLPTFLADEGQIERVVVNLLSNALNYTQANGTVRVKTGLEAGKVIFQVVDTGIGIEPAALPHIFERFYRSDEARLFSDGTGLGLAIVKEMVDGHGGSITVDSQPARGSSFTVTLPTVLPNKRVRDPE